MWRTEGGNMQRVLVAFVLLSGCASSEDPDMAAFERRLELSRELEPPVAGLPDRDIGASIDAIAEAAAQGSDATYSPTLADCVIHHYERDGVVLAVYERCDGYQRRLFVYDESGVFVRRA